MVNIEQLKERALKILSPIREADITINYGSDSSFKSERSSAGRLLPDYFLVYFLFSTLLKFRSLGRFEKVAWSFPIEYNCKVFYIEHRKLGLGIFVQDLENDKKDAEIIVKKINGAVKAITPFFVGFFYNGLEWFQVSP